MTNSRYIKKCKYCGEEFGVSKKSELNRRKYCSTKCSHADPARRGSISGKLKKHPGAHWTVEARERMRAIGAKYGAKRHQKWLNSKAVVNNSWSSGGKCFLDITNKQLQEYRERHKVCEICGRTEVVTVNNQFIKSDKPISLAADHDHKAGHFRGVLCRRCNRALGWYDTYEDSIIRYLAKE